MIATDVELQLTRDRLKLAEAALESLRRDFLPHNQIQYRMFSGTTIDLIRAMRGEIEAYLGMGPDADLSMVEGVIRFIDLDARRFVLRERPEGQPDLPCEYPDALAETVKELLDRRVIVSGLLVTGRVSQHETLEVVSLEPADPEQPPINTDLSNVGAGMPN